MRDSRTTHHERALLGMVILDPSILDRLEIDLAGYSFTDQDSNTIWPVLIELRRKGFPIADTQSLAIELKPYGITHAHLARLSDDAGMRGQDAYHVSVLVDRMRFIRLERFQHRLGQMIADQSMEVAEVEAWAADELASLSSHGSPSHGSDTQLGALMAQVADICDDPNARKIETGIPPLDRAIGGFRDGQLIILGARPSVGKSALASQIAVNVAKGGGRVLFISLEMSGHELAARTIAFETALPMGSLLDGTIDPSQRTQIHELANQYRKFPMYVEDRSTMTTRRLASLVKRYASKERLSLVVVDYLGLIEGENKQSLRESTEQISKALKQLAKSEKVPIMALSQLNRDSEKGEASIAVPTLAQLRNSGSLEQDTDIVLLLHRESRTARNATLIVAKGRNVPTGKLSLDYVGPRYEFLPALQNEYSEDFQ